VHKEMINFFLGWLAGMFTIVWVIWFAIGDDK
jgi:hypothetical protein